MIYIKDDEQSTNLITNFLKQNKYVVYQINFTQNSAFVDAREELGILKGTTGLLSDCGFRSVGMFAMLDIADERTAKKEKFIVNDFEFKSVFDGEVQICFNSEWREYMYKNLPEEQKKSYSEDLEHFISHNIWENI